MIDDLKIYLPKFLSPAPDEELFKGLKDFPDNIDDRLYTTALQNQNIVFQGDGMNDMMVVNLPLPDIKPVKSIILSNTCDINVTNERYFSSKIMYAPIFNLSKYRASLHRKSKKPRTQIEDHIQAIRRQKITQIFFLPKFGNNMEDSIVFLDRVNNISSSFIDSANIAEKKIFTLSNYGFYLFILKLSIHFTRIQDKVDRPSIYL